MATKKAGQKPREILWTPPGRVSYPYFASVDSGRQYSDDSYKTDLIIPKAIFKERGKELQAAVLKVGKEYFGDKFSFKGKWFIPFKDLDAAGDTPEAMKNCIQIRAKSKPFGNKPARKPLFLAPRKNKDGKFPELTPEEVQNIKGGDWCVLNVTVFPYDQQGGGVSFGLNAVQFWKTDEGFGQGRSKLLETAEELEAEVDDVTNDDVVDEGDEESIV